MVLIASNLESLESSLEFWNNVAYIATGFVFIGVFGESVGELWNFPKNDIWRTRLTRYSALILIIGLAGELASLVRTSPLSGQIVAILKKQAGDATLEAGNANARAAKLEQEAAGLTKTAEDERTARLRLEAQIQPRDLTIEQQRAIGKACKRFAGNNVSVRSYSLDPEGWRLGQLIIAALQSGGIRVTDSTSNLMQFGGFTTGVQVSGPIRQKELVESLVAALSANKELLPVLRNPKPSPDNIMVEVMVGVKPFAKLK